MTGPAAPNGVPDGWRYHRPEPDGHEGGGRQGPGRAAGEGSQADRLLELARAKYRIGLSTENRPFAVARDGPNIARRLKGDHQSIRAGLAFDFSEQFAKAPSSTALADCLSVLEGEAARAEPEPVELRVAKYQDGLVLDLGDVSGRCVVVTPKGWRTEDRSPVLFKRSELTGALPVPIRGEGIEGLRDFLNLAAHSWPVVLGWLVAVFLPELPQPVLVFSGEHGAGKSGATRILIDLVDPSSVPFKSVPKDLENWALCAANSRVLAVDNVSSIPDWWSDAICRTVTGDGMVRRALYTSDDLSALCFQRAIMLNWIDVAQLRGDLADRLVTVELERIDPKRRRSKVEMRAKFEARRPALLGGLLDLVVSVLAQLPSVHLESMPRMADFARVLAAIDQLEQTTALSTYLCQRERISEDVLEADMVAVRLREYMTARGGPFTGTAGELLEALEAHKPENLPKSWPNSPRSLSSKLRRIAPALRAVGITIEPPTESNRQPGTRARLFHIEVAAATAAQPSLPTPGSAAPSPAAPGPEPAEGLEEETL